MKQLNSLKITLSLLLVLLSLNEAKAYKAWFRMQVEAKCKDTDGNVRDDIGFVAVKFSTQPTAATKRTDLTQAHNGTEYWFGSGASYYQITAYVLARGDGNWQFDHWELEDGTTLSNSNQEQGTASHTYRSTNRCPGNSSSGTHEHATYFTEHTYYAVFREVVTQVVFAEAQPETLGEVKYLKENSIGEEITLRTYTLDYHNKFLGWVKQGDENNIITTDRVLSFTITDETKGTYIAKYDDGYNFVRFKNFDTGRYMDFTSDDGTLQNLTALELKPSLNDVISEAGSIIEIKEGTVKGSSGSKHTYFDYYMQNAKASKFYDFDPTDPDPTSPSGIYLRMPHDVDNNVDTWALSTDDNVQSGYRIGDQNGSPHVYMGKRDDADWWIEPMDKDLETCENYFSLDPNKLVDVDGKYYTTLRTSWNILFNPEQMTPYVVTAVDEQNGTFEMEALTGNIIPAGTPVIIETSSNVVLDNRMVPTKDAAASGAVPSGNLLQTSTKYFPNQSVSTSNNYKKLTVNAAGQLSFGGNALNSVNGNEAYLCVENEVILPSKIPILPLADIEQSGVKNKLYTIADELIAVEYRQVGEGNDVYLWCKDQGNVSIDKTERTSTQVDFMKQQGQQVGEWDQSNWVVLKLTGNTAISIADGAKGHHIDAASITGLYVDDVNYMIEVTGNQLTVGGTAEYTPNVYSPANFMLSNLNIRGGQGGQTSGDNDTYYFFMNPKIQEICKITFAEWKAPGNDDPGYFTVPHTSGFDGAFNIGGWQYNEYNDVSDDLVDESSYFFNAVVNRANINAYGPKAVEIEHNTTPDGVLIVYPTDLMAEGHNVPTAIDNLQSGKTAIKVVYYNTMGIESTVPYPGINIVVTEYSDGSRSAVKMIR